MSKDEKNYTTQHHPDGDRARDSQGRALDDFGRVPEQENGTKPVAENPAADATNDSQAEKPGKDKPAGDKS